MTVTASNADRNAGTELISVTIDGIAVEVPKGTLVIRAAEQIGIQIPRFCDHPLLEPAGACRQCLVEISTPDREGALRPMPKPQASCTIEATDGMVVATQHTSEVADKAQHGMMEFLLINHPLDCPVCDKGGECPLQNQAMSNGRSTSRFVDIKRTFPKPIKVSTEVLLDRDRCILCQRCTRFSDEIAGDPFIALQGRGGGTPGDDVHGLHGSQVGSFDSGVLQFASSEGQEVDPVREDDLVGPGGAAGFAQGLNAGPIGAAETDTSGRPFSSYFSGNTIQICPVGALTSASYRFRSRPFDLVSSPAVAEHDASGSAIRIDHRRGVVLRRLAGDDAEVNEEWITDKDRFAFTWQSAPDRLELPLVRDENGELVPTSWADALDVAATGLRQAQDGGGVGFLPGGRLTVEDAYAWSKFARVAFDTNDVDHRARPHSDEESDFLARHVAATGLGVTYSDLERAGHALLVGLEPEEECGTIFLRLRKGVLAGTVSVSTIAPWATRGTVKMRARHVPAAPGTEPEVLAAIAPGETDLGDLAEQLAQPGAVILVGERAAEIPGTLTAVADLAERTGARLAWVPRRAGDRGAVEAGLLPGLLPAGRGVADADARVDTGAVWGVDSLPATPGRDLSGIIGAAHSGELPGLVVGGLELVDLPDVAGAREALAAAGFVVQLEVRRSELTEHADVVLPVAPPAEKAGTYVNWEGRTRPFGQVLASRALSDREVLVSLGRELGVELGLDELDDVHRELAELTDDGAGRVRSDFPVLTVAPGHLPEPGPGQAVLATWKMHLDSGRGQDGEPHLAGTAHRPVVRLGPDTAAALEVQSEDTVTVTGVGGSITLPLAVTTMPERVVWLPANSPGSRVRETLGAAAGAVVTLSAGEDR